MNIIKGFSLSINLDNAIDYIMNNRDYIQRGDVGTREGHVGGNHYPIRTLPTLYNMCKTIGKQNNYNHYLIDDLLVDRENFQKYQNGFNGFKIVETSFYKMCDNEDAVLMNYPIFIGQKETWIKIKFNDKNLFKDFINSINLSEHKLPIVIAGNWELTNNLKYICECMFQNMRQL